MSAANFQTMRDFPLFARDFDDEVEYYDICDIVQSDLDDINRDFLFHKITLLTAAEVLHTGSISPRSTKSIES